MGAMIMPVVLGGSRKMQTEKIIKSLKNDFLEQNCYRYMPIAKSRIHVFSLFSHWRIKSDAVEIKVFITRALSNMG